MLRVLQAVSTGQCPHLLKSRAGEYTIWEFGEACEEGTPACASGEGPRSHAGEYTIREFGS